MTRAERRRAGHDARIKDRDLPHRKVNDVRPPPPILPRTQRQMQEHMSGKHPDKYRDPVNRAERREWDRFWQLKGRGFTKPAKKGERF